MSFLDWFIVPVQHHYADFKGRASRRQFWMFALVYFLLSIVVGIIDGLIGMQIIGIIFTFALIVPILALTARRLHDIGRSGWWQLLGLVPFIGWVIILVFVLLPGTAGPNKYDTDPVV